MSKAYSVLFFSLLFISTFASGTSKSTATLDLDDTDHTLPKFVQVETKNKVKKVLNNKAINNPNLNNDQTTSTKTEGVTVVPISTSSQTATEVKLDSSGNFYVTAGLIIMIALAPLLV